MILNYVCLDDRPAYLDIELGLDDRPAYLDIELGLDVRPAYLDIELGPVPLAPL